MNFNDVKELISIIDKSSFKTFELSIDNCSVKMSKTETAVFSENVNNDIYKENKETHFAETNTDYKSEVIEKETPIVEKEVEGNIVKAPLVGTFYSSSAPDKPPYAAVGAKVKKGDVLCIIEAMKIMNEVVSEFDGEIKKVLVKNEELVEYGQPMFIIG